ncbi:MAG: HPF/RaiA family ribosome-associated protein [Acidobacteriota bacterium]|nr:HPF/RaiA family ribosome-associated protein [Acidobacteriota bacterium]
MQLPVQVTFRDMDRSEALEQEILRRAEKLETYYPRITACRVSIERPHRHQQEGKRFRVRIDITVPGEEIVVSHDAATLHAHLKDVEATRRTKATDVDTGLKYGRVAIREAFETARRRLQDYARRQRGDVKTHEAPPHGAVARLLPDQQCGFLQAADGHEVYFHRDSVVNGAFEDLTVGAAVTFVETRGDKGPQASTVRLVGKHHYA